MKKVIITLCLLLVSFPYKVNALCSLDDKGRYNSLASNIITSYSYKQADDLVTFSITFHNVHEDLIVIDKNTKNSYKTNTQGLSTITIDGYSPGKQYTFSVSTSNQECSYLTLYTIYVTLPSYNKYYNDDICYNLTNYSLCQKWMDTSSYTYNQLAMEISKYKKANDTNSPVQEEIEPEKEKVSIVYIIGNFWAKYYLIILLPIIFLGLGIIIIYERKTRVKF